MKLYDELVWRGLIKDVSNEEEIRRLLDEESVTFYWGTDPSGDSLHIGHLSSLLLAKRLKDAGHHPILLVGGATGLIGDPKPNAERAMIPVSEVEENYQALKKQIEGLFGYEMVNNYDWSKEINFVEFLRDYGKYFPVNYMLDKDIVRRRLETGITYAEFSYMIMQALDFLWLYENKNCILQVEGSDQWGNITAGIDLIRRRLGKEAYGFTMPLIETQSGEKFGKSEGNALWIDKNKTSSYELYQYLLNMEDSMIGHYLRVFTFLSKTEIEALEKETLNNPGERIAQKALAKELITFLHGEEEYKKAVHISEVLFSGNIKELTVDEVMVGFKDIPSFKFEEGPIIDILVNHGIASSKREAREFLGNGSITVNGEKISDENLIIDKSKAIDKKIVVIRKGKKHYHLGMFN